MRPWSAGKGCSRASGTSWQAPPRGPDGRIAEANTAIGKGRGRIGRWPLRSDSWELVGPGLERSYGDGRRAMKEVRGVPPPRTSTPGASAPRTSGTSCGSSATPGRSCSARRSSRPIELADLLGDHHDLAVLAENSGPANLGDRAAFETAIERRQGELLEAALEIGQRLYAEKPKAFERRIERYWGPGAGTDPAPTRSTSPGPLRRRRRGGRRPRAPRRRRRRPRRRG